jgi:hypothetical protein
LAPSFWPGGVLPVTAAGDDADTSQKNCSDFVCAEADFRIEETGCSTTDPCDFDARGEHDLESDDLTSDQEYRVEGTLTILEFSGNQDTCSFVSPFGGCQTSYQWFSTDNDCYSARAITEMYVDGQKVDEAVATEDSMGCS